MISVILYGRNDYHGYNYHKRFALSLNCIAETLSLPGDEILFIDYNTPDDEPTIIESLQDTLTKKTKDRLKVFRLRPKHHQLIKSHLAVCEPLARNIALRRSNPENKWILSTNIDMIFVPFSSDQTLSSIVAGLSDGFYQLPRFEIPENLWESKFDRFYPDKNIEFLQQQAQFLHLNTIVRRDDFRMYDNPGDFQLMLRKDIFQIGGFDEGMVQGWHVDSNLSKRMFLYYEGKIGSLEDLLAGYHCNHTRKSSLFHSKYRMENDWIKWVQNLNSPLVNQFVDWGLLNEEIEEVPLNVKHVDILQNLASEFEQVARAQSRTSVEDLLKRQWCFDKRNRGELAELYDNGVRSSDPLTKENLLCSNGGVLQSKAKEITLNQRSYNTLSGPIDHIFAHLMDHLCHLPSSTAIAYIGQNSKLPTLLQRYFFERKLDCSVLKNGNVKELYMQASLLIFDFSLGKEVEKDFLRAVKLEKENRKNLKFIGINVLHTDFRALFQHHLSLVTSSYVSGIIYGYIDHKKKRPKSKGVKRKLLFTLHYLLVRYCSKKMRNCLYHTKFAKKSLKF